MLQERIYNKIFAGAARARHMKFVIGIEGTTNFKRAHLTREKRRMTQHTMRSVRFETSYFR